MPDKRLIDANALLKRIAHHTVHDSLKRITFEAANTYEQVKGDMFSLVQKAPVVDAVEVVHARWFQHRLSVPKGRGQTYLVYGCSKCHKHEKKRTAYCPNCGAKMDGGASDAAD